MTGTSPGRARSRRRRLVLLAAAAVLACVAVAAVGFGVAGSPDRPAANRAAAAGSASPSAAPRPSPAAGSGGPAPASRTGAAPTSPPTSPPTAPGTAAPAAALPPSQAPVPLDAVASGPTGISAEVVRVEAVRATGSGPGYTSGPALRISVRVHNGSTTPLRLDDVAVTMSYGGARTPASPVDDPSAAELHGALAPGGSADGRYLFTVPADDRGAVTVTVGYQADAPFLVFTGRA